MLYARRRASALDARCQRAAICYARAMVLPQPRHEQDVPAPRCVTRHAAAAQDDARVYCRHAMRCLIILSARERYAMLR